MMDHGTIEAVESSIYAAGYPRDAAAVLLIEVDGAVAGLDDDMARSSRICRECGARETRSASDAAERARLWQGRKKAFGAMGRVAPHLAVQDAVVPRTKLAARSSPASRRSARASASASATSSTPATATCIRTSPTTATIPTSARACTRRCAR